MEKLLADFSVGLFFWQSLVFLVLLFLLRKYAWKPILTAVKQREESIEKALNAAEEAKAEVSSMQDKSEALLQEARTERDAMLKEARETKENIINKAADEASKKQDEMLDKARAEIQNEKKAAIAELKGTVAKLSIEIAEKILKSELSDEDKQKKLVNDLLEDVKMN